MTHMLMVEILGTPMTLDELMEIMAALMIADLMTYHINMIDQAEVEDIALADIAMITNQDGTDEKETAAMTHPVPAILEIHLVPIHAHPNQINTVIIEAQIMATRALPHHLRWTLVRPAIQSILGLLMALLIADMIQDHRITQVKWRKQALRLRAQATLVNLVMSRSTPRRQATQVDRIAIHQTLPMAHKQMQLVFLQTTTRHQARYRGEIITPIYAPQML